MTVFFDSYTEIGPRNAKHPAERWSLDHLLEDMELCSISAALVAHTQSVMYDAMTANRRLVDMLKPHPQLVPVWNLIPLGTDEMPPLQSLGAEIASAGVGALAIHPKSNRWEMRSRRGRELLTWLQDQPQPLLVSWAELEGWQNLAYIMEAFPRLKLLLRGMGWGDQRLLLAALEEFPGLHVSLENYQAHYGVEDLVQHGFSDRVCYASNAPKMSVGAHRFAVDYADVDDTLKQAVAGGNLCRLMQRGLPTPASAPKQDDVIMESARAGKPLPVPVLDFHLHVLDEGLNGAGWHVRMLNGDVAGMTRLLRKCGVVGGGLMSWNGTVGCDVIAGNECVRNALDNAPDGYWGLPTFDPTHFSREEMTRMVAQSYSSDHRLLGMKPYQRFAVPYDDPSYEPWWEYGNEHRLYALIHRIRGDFSEVENLARRYPQVRWVVAHCGANYKVADMAIACARAHPNVYLEITLTPVPGGIIEYLVQGAGADRVLYGSDAPMRDPRQQLGWVVHTRLSESDKRKVLGSNAVRVLEPALGRWPQLRETWSNHAY